jgi:hypothetical protein
MVFLAASAQSTLLLFFSVTLFAINPSFTVMFFQNHCFNPPTKAKRRLHSNRHHRAALVPEKNNSKLLYIICSYIRALA